VAGLTGKDSHYFLVTPDDFDNALGKVKTLLTESAPAKDKP